MLALLKRTRTGVFVAMIGLLCLSIISPVLTMASSDLLAGDEAVVTSDAMLRSDYGYTAQVLAEVAADTPASIIDGPFAAPDGSSWYSVQTLGTTGYLPAFALSGVTGAEEPADAGVTETAETSDEIPWKEPIGYGVANDDVICRDAATTSAIEIVVVGKGQTIEITGEEVWAEEIGWTPVNCAGVGGFISSAYITVDEPAEETELTAESTGETTTEPSKSTTTTEAAPDEETTTGAESLDSESGEPRLVEAPKTLPWSEPIGYAVTTADLVCRGDASTSANQIVVLPAGESVEVTGEVIWAEGIGWTPVNCAGVGGFVSSDYLTTEDATDEDASQDVAAQPTETPVTTPTETATDAIETIVATPTLVVTQEPEARNVIEQGGASQDIQDASQKVVIEQTATAEPTEPVETIVASPEATDDAPQAIESGEAVVASPTPTDVASPVATEAEASPTEPADATPGATPTGEIATEEPTATATSTAPADSDIEEMTALVVDESPSTSPVTDDQIIGTATVQGTSGEGLACRTEADASAPVITLMPEGLNVMVLSQPDDNGFMSIVCANQIGFADVQYLWSGGLDTSFDINLSSMATVTGTGGGGLNCRSEASMGARVIGWFAEGSAVNVRGDAQGNWAPVVCGGQNGYVFIDYLTAVPDSESAGGTGTADFGGSTSTLTRALTNALMEAIASAGSGSLASPSDDSGSSDVSGSAVVSGTNGDGLRCRTGAGTDSSTITVVAEGSLVFLRGSASGNWQPVVCAGQNGYMHTSFLSSSGSIDIPDPDPAPAPSGLGNGDHAQVTSNLNLRYEPNTGSGVATYAPSGTVVLITGPEAGNGYYPVNWDGLKGYMHGDYLVETDTALSERGGSGNPGSNGSVSDGGGGSSTGNAIVDFAMGYVGYPYVWATHGPYSFDCSGFTYWVIKNVVGVDIGTGTWTQVSSGTPVSRSNLQPGDLVFFQNTFKAGLSHVGIYIGGGQFVHAENENTGVKVSDLNSSYYGSRWYGAVRIN